MKSQSLQKLFRLWTILLIVVPALAGMGIYTWSQITSAEQNNLQIINQRVGFRKQLIESWLQERATDIRSLSAAQSLWAWDESDIKRFLTVMQKSRNDFDSLSYIDKNGICRASTHPLGNRFASALGRPYFLAALSGKDYISNVVISRSSGVPIIRFSSPVYNRAGNFRGLILGSVRTTHLESLLRTSWKNQTEEVVLVNHAGTMLTPPRFAQELIDKGLVKAGGKLNFRLSSDGLQKIHLGKSGTATWMNYRGSKVLGAYQSLPGQNWTLIGSINESELFAPIYTQLMHMAGFTALLAILLLPLATWVTDRIKCPIEWLTAQANLVANENYQAVAQSDHLENIPQELSFLCETFTMMSHKIRHSVTLLKENEAKLESQVSEIQAVNAALQTEIFERGKAEEALLDLNAELEVRVMKRTKELQDLNSLLEEEVAERQSAQEALSESREHYEALLKQSSEAVVVIDPETTQILEVNEAFLRMFEVSPVNIQSKKLSEIAPGKMRFLREVAAALQEGKSPPALTETCEQTSGQTLYLEGLASLIHHRDKHLILISYRNVTAQKQAESERIENEKKVSAMERMASLGTLSAGVAHEINQPLQALKVTLDGMIYWHEKGREPDVEHLIASCRRMSGQAERINRIVKRLRDFVNRSRFTDNERVDLNQTIKQALEMLNERLKAHHIQLRETLTPELSFWGDSGRLEEVVLNTVINAMEALDTVELKTKEIEIATRKTPEHIVMEISNNGPAIPAETISQLFTPFYTTKNSSDNMGLGLSIVHSIVEAHGGLTQAFNHTGGVTFRYAFPIQELG
jgi:PAS domain S-box-containing protein